VVSKPPAILLMGPTASGKSALAMEVAARIPVEIVSVDSAQVYRGMDVGTAKPSAAERAAVPHHLVDIIEPTESYSAARFRADSLALAQDIAARGRIPLLVGGTMLYFRALTQGLAELPPADVEVRAQIDADAARLGWPALHAALARVDPETAARLEPADAQRIQRALEVHRLTGEPMSRLVVSGGDAALPFMSIQIALAPSDRATLHERIAQRFVSMLAAGLVDELADLRSRYALHPGLPSMRCVGYRQAWEHLDGAYDRTTLLDRGIFATRQLAKRQLTWLRSWPGAIEFDCLDPHLAHKVLAAIEWQLDR
jgi:tRNA dimethylallyltransferase